MSEINTSEIKVKDNVITSKASNKEYLFKVVETTLVLIDFISQQHPEIYKNIAKDDLSILDNVIDSFYLDSLSKGNTRFPLAFELEYKTKSKKGSELPDGIDYTFYSKEPVNQFLALYQAISNEYLNLLTQLLQEDIDGGKITHDYIQELKKSTLNDFFSSEDIELNKDIYNLVSSIFDNTYLKGEQ